MRRWITVLAAVLIAVVIALAALAQTQRLPPGLTPLGPLQPPLGAPPATTQVQGPGPAIQSEPLPPVTAPAPVVQLPPTATQPATTQPATTQPAPIEKAPAPIEKAPAPTEKDWQSRPAATIQALDKVTARVTSLTGKVGETLRFGTLSILVRSCVVRPPDVPADAAAFLEVTDRGATPPLFRGWMVRSSPGIGVIEHPVYDLRLSGCQG